MKKGEKLKELIAKKGISIEDFAANIDVSVSSVFKYYNKENFDSELLEKFCSILDVPVTFFFDDKYAMNENSAIINGNGNSVVAGKNNIMELSSCQSELEKSYNEIKHLNEILSAKDKIIEVMTSLQSKRIEPIIDIYTVDGTRKIDIRQINNIIPCTGGEPEFADHINSGSKHEYPCCIVSLNGKSVYVMQDSTYIWNLITNRLSSIIY